MSPSFVFAQERCQRQLLCLPHLALLLPQISRRCIDVRPPIGQVDPVSIPLVSVRIDICRPSEQRWPPSSIVRTISLPALLRAFCLSPFRVPLLQNLLLVLCALCVSFSNSICPGILYGIVGELSSGVGRVSLREARHGSVSC